MARTPEGEPQSEEPHRAGPGEGQEVSGLVGREGQERLGAEVEAPDAYEILLDTETVIEGNYVYRTVISRGEEDSPSKGDRPLVVFDHEQIPELGPGERVSYFGRYTGKVPVETELEILEDSARCLVLFLNERRERMGRST